jgi:electron transport complex protein RnfG
MTAPHHHGGPPAAAPRGAGTPAWRLVATLAMAGAISGGLIASVYRMTLPAVERHAAERESAAIYEVLKAPASWDTLYLAGDALTRTAPDPRGGAKIPKVFEGFDAAGKRIGVAITASEPGFQDAVTLMIGFEPKSGALTGFTILEQKETPGLGDKVEHDTGFTGQFTGRTPPLQGVKGRPGAAPNEVQTITGATISSRAVIRIINNAVARWSPLIAAWDQGGGK